MPLLKGPPLSRAGWTLCNHWNYFWLLAGESAGPVQVRVAIPDGTYRLSVVIGGAVILKVGDGEPIRLQARVVEPAQVTDAEIVDVGPVIIRNQTFEATLTPDTSAHPFLLRQLVFAPLAAYGIVPDPAHRRQLETLGYLDEKPTS